jgi:hypothetical protein
MAPKATPGRKRRGEEGVVNVGGGAGSAGGGTGGSMLGKVAVALIMLFVASFVVSQRMILTSESSNLAAASADQLHDKDAKGTRGESHLGHLTEGGHLYAGMHNPHTGMGAQPLKPMVGGAAGGPVRDPVLVTPPLPDLAQPGSRTGGGGGAGVGAGSSGGGGIVVKTKKEPVVGEGFMGAGLEPGAPRGAFGHVWDHGATPVLPTPPLPESSNPGIRGGKPITPMKGAATTGGAAGIGAGAGAGAGAVAIKKEPVVGEGFMGFGLEPGAPRGAFGHVWDHGTHPVVLTPPAPGAHANLVPPNDADLAAMKMRQQADNVAKAKEKEKKEKEKEKEKAREKEREREREREKVAQKHKQAAAVAKAASESARMSAEAEADADADAGAVVVLNPPPKVNVASIATSESGPHFSGETIHLHAHTQGKAGESNTLPYDYHARVSPRLGSDITSTPAQAHILQCPNQSKCIVPELLLKPQLKVYLCKHPVRQGVRFYFLAREGLLLHPGVSLVPFEEIHTADFAVYLPGSAPWHRTECNMTSLADRLIVLDEFDGHSAFAPDGNPRVRDCVFSRDIRLHTPNVIDVVQTSTATPMPLSNL